MIDPADFILRQTALVAPPLVPEIALHLATEITPLWRATQATLDDADLPPPYWAFAWPGGQALARFLLDHPGEVAGKHVLDFAAGSGLVAIAAARAGAAFVTAADIDPMATAVIRLNARANGIAIDVVNASPIDGPVPWDVVLAGDVCYEQPMADRGLAWLRRLTDRGIAVLLADPGRTYAPSQGLLEIGRYTVPTSRDLEDRDVRETIVWRLLATG